MKFKIAIIILAFITNNIFASGSNTNATSDVITAQEVIKEVKKLSTDNLIEKTFNKKVSAQDKQQILDNMQADIAYYEKYKLSLLGQAGQIGRLFLGMFGTAFFYTLAYDQYRRRISGYYYAHEYSYRQAGNLATFFSVLSGLSLSQFILAANRLRLNNNLNIIRNMELFVKVMPVKR